jgi:dipeptidyl aminopeptidase/acylaminoacyl peptidase
VTASTSTIDLVRAVLKTSSTVLADLDRAPGAPERLLVRSDRTGTMQLYELSSGELIQLTGLTEPVAAAHYVPGGRQAVLQIDEAGDERHQLFLIDLDEAARSTVTSIDRLTPLTADPRFVHEFAGVSPDGVKIAYVSNRANGVDFDLWVCDLPGGEHRCLHADRAWFAPASGFSPDGRLVSILRPGERPLDEDLVLVDVETGEARIVLAHPGEAALVGAPAWIDPATFYVSSNVGRDRAAIVRYDGAQGSTTSLSGAGESFDAEVVSSADGGTLAVIENRDGTSAVRLYDAADATSPTPGPVVTTFEPGVVSSHWIAPPLLSAGGSRLYYTLSTARLAGDVFVYDREASVSLRLTTSPAGLEPDELVSPEPDHVTSFDGETIPVFRFHPRGSEPRPPVVVVIHGGPESQATLSFNPVIQALLLAGYGVVVPNVRGSTGYGRRYASLDDTTKRLDSVRDLTAVHDALESLGFDPGRAALWGGSYGGYMVLAGLAFYPELWAAGVDIVGISNFVTFLENTADYRRAHREHEYGSLVRDREFLVRASPITSADAISAPLFVIHGRNDPRVPLGEAQQLTESLQSRGVPCTLRVYDDEGHGLARLDNRLDAYPRAIAFLDQALRPPTA